MKNYGEINIGRVKKTDGQIKKHRQQMSLEELDFLQTKLHNLRHIKISDHLERKFIGYDLKVVKELPYRDNVKNLIIEYNETPSDNYMDRRILIRSDESYDVDIQGEICKCNICIVYSVVTNSVITIYWNKILDNHKSINWKRYNKNLKIIY